MQESNYNTFSLFDKKALITLNYNLNHVTAYLIQIGKLKEKL